ncbi:MAG: 2Fe-2S ferredoxin [Limisphaerales bacterium]|jgi:2Fe-2S ferredoxin
MPAATYVEVDGTTHTIDVAVGKSLMEAAVAQLIPGIDGDCGGLCACGTCHVYVDNILQCGEANELEQGILEFAYDVQPTSRLSCQIMMTEALDGITVRLPKRQY